MGFMLETYYDDIGLYQTLDISAYELYCVWINEVDWDYYLSLFRFLVLCIKLPN